MTDEVPDLRTLPYADWDNALRETLENPTRFHYRHRESLPDWGSFKRHRFDWEPVGAPAKHEFTDEWGKTKRYGYDPELVAPENERFGANWRWLDHPDWRREMYRGDDGENQGFDEDVPPEEGMLYRGLSHEEWEEAKQRGYLQSNGEYNIGGEQGTLFSTKPSQASSYATGFAPWHRKPGFQTPSYVVAVPRPGDAYAHPNMTSDTSEIVVPGQVPFNQIQRAWQFRPYAIQHDDMDVRTEDFGKTWMGRPSMPGNYNAYRELPLGSPRTAMVKLAHPLYVRWVFSPASGEVELSDNSGDPLDVKYHTDLARERNEPNLVHGYAYRIGDGWRLSDWDSKPLSDPFVIAQVMRKLQSSKPASGPQEGSWGPDYDEDWDRLHAGIPG